MAIDHYCYVCSPLHIFLWTLHSLLHRRAYAFATEVQGAKGRNFSTTVRFSSPPRTNRILLQCNGNASKDSYMHNSLPSFPWWHLCIQSSYLWEQIWHLHFHLGEYSTCKRIDSFLKERNSATDNCILLHWGCLVLLGSPTSALGTFL
jgi:hypothetical protein